MQQRVLIVDDEPLVADTLSIIFSKHGYDCQTAYSGDQALQVAEAFAPELLLCDVSMPGIDGLAVASAISRLLPACRIMMLTGQYANLQRIHQYFDGLTTHSMVATKPARPEDLLQQASSLLALA
jgi:CheY-like chemotaxis protein